MAEEVVVVADEAFQLAAVDEVECLAVGPGGLEVVDLETAVRGDPEVISIYLTTLVGCGW